jgi:hypothetical protein
MTQDKCCLLEGTDHDHDVFGCLKEVAKRVTYSPHSASPLQNKKISVLILSHPPCQNFLLFFPFLQGTKLLLLLATPISILYKYQHYHRKQDEEERHVYVSRYYWYHNQCAVLSMVRKHIFVDHHLSHCSSVLVWLLLYLSFLSYSPSLAKLPTLYNLSLPPLSLSCHHYVTFRGLQRNGMLIHGKSWHLKDHHSESMIKKALLFRNLVSTIHHEEVKTAPHYNEVKETRWLQRAFPFVSSSLFEMMNEADTPTENSTARFQYINEKIKHIKPSHLFDEGVTTPFVNLGSVEAFFTEYPRTAGANTLIVVFPGILSEFIEIGTFEEFFDKTSTEPNALRDEFDEKFKTAKDSRDKVDRVFSTESLLYEEMPLTKLVEVVSVKVGEVDRAFDLLRLRSPMGSLETLGTEEESMECYMRRLDKYFKIMDNLPNKIHFIGYSRGALVALETLVRSRERVKQHPWSARVKTMIGLGGVLWGTEVADTTATLGHPNKQAHDLLVNCSKALDYSNMGDMGTLKHAKEVATNTKLIVELAARLSAVDLPTMAHPSIAEEFTDAVEVELNGLARLLYAFLFQHFRMNEPVADYYGNIKTMKILVEKISAGIDGLTTATRLKWWTKNKVPTDVKYYSIAGTMQDAEADVHVVERDVAFSQNSVDFRFNRQFYYQAYTLTNKMLHDGQISVERAQFYSSLHQALNPNQKKYYTSLLSVINAHHWGLALTAALDNPATKPNPFPRKSLVKALGAFLVSDTDL